MCDSRLDLASLKVIIHCLYVVYNVCLLLSANVDAC